MVFLHVYLQQIATQVDQLVGGSQELVALTIGGASAVLDNVPLVAATMGMYDITQVSCVGTHCAVINLYTWSISTYSYSHRFPLISKISKCEELEKYFS